MAYRKVSVPSPVLGQAAEGYDIPILESTERWSEVKLEDGTVFRAKISIGQVVRLINERDPAGNPVYSVNGAPTIVMVEYGNIDPEVT